MHKNNAPHCRRIARAAAAVLAATTLSLTVAGPADARVNTPDSRRTAAVALAAADQISSEMDIAWTGDWKFGNGVVTISGSNGTYTGTVKVPVSFGSGCTHPVGETLFHFNVTSERDGTSYGFQGDELWYTDACTFHSYQPTRGEIGDHTHSGTGGGDVNYWFMLYSATSPEGGSINDHAVKIIPRS